MVPLSEKEKPKANQFGPSVQSGVDAALSRRRSPVRIRYGSLAWCGTPTDERSVLETGVCEFESHPHYFVNRIE